MLNPKSVYDHTLKTHLKRAGFIEKSEPEIEDLTSRYISTYVYASKSLNGKEGGDDWTLEETIDVVGIPMGLNILIVHAIVRHNGDNVKIKLKMNDNQRSDGQISEIIEKELITKLIELLSININDLPLELKLKICEYLTFKDVNNFSQANKLWQKFFSDFDDVIWKTFLRREFLSIHDNRVEEELREMIEQDMRRYLTTESWKECFKEAYLKRKKLETTRWATRGLLCPPERLALPPSPPRAAIAWPYQWNNQDIDPLLPSSHIPIPLPYPNRNHFNDLLRPTIPLWFH